MFSLIFSVCPLALYIVIGFEKKKYGLLCPFFICSTKCRLSNGMSFISIHKLIAGQQSAPLLPKCSHQNVF